MSHPKPKLFKTPDHRWGEGKVHVYVYSRENKLWYTMCAPLGTNNQPHGKVLDQPFDKDLVTCKKCR